MRHPALSLGATSFVATLLVLHLMPADGSKRPDTPPSKIEPVDVTETAVPDPDKPKPDDQKPPQHEEVEKPTVKVSQAMLVAAGVATASPAPPSKPVETAHPSARTEPSNQPAKPAEQPPPPKTGEQAVAVSKQASASDVSPKAPTEKPEPVRPHSVAQPPTGATSKLASSMKAGRADIVRGRALEKSAHGELPHLRFSADGDNYWRFYEQLDGALFIADRRSTGRHIRYRRRVDLARLAAGHGPSFLPATIDGRSPEGSAYSANRPRFVKEDRDTAPIFEAARHDKLCTRCALAMLLPKTVDSGLRHAVLGLLARKLGGGHALARYAAVYGRYELEGARLRLHVVEAELEDGTRQPLRLAVDLTDIISNAGTR